MNEDPAGETLIPYPGTPEDYVEGPEGSGQWWCVIDQEIVFGPLAIRDDWTPADLFAKHAEPPRRTVLKSVIISRLIEAGKIDAAKAALEQDASAYARWWAPDRPAINHDDPDAIALLQGIGADPDVILAP